MLFLALLLASARPRTVSAAEGRGEESADATARVQKLNRYAMQLFDDMNFQLAEKTLLEALSVVEKSNIANGPAGLATHGNLAVLYSSGLKNPDKAVFHFKKALAIKPDLKMGKQRATPETEANLARAKTEMAAGGVGGAVEPPAETAESQGGGMKCPAGGDGQAGEAITLKCSTGSDLRPATVMLYYKANGSDQYQTIAMAKSSVAGGVTNWTATIPGSDTKARLVPYYVDARNQRGASIALSGRDESPSMIVIKGADAPAAAAANANPDGDNPDEEEAEPEEIDDNNPLARLERERRKEQRGSQGTWWVSLGIGSGIGYAAGHATEAFGGQGVSFTPGIALASLGHAVPEIGYFIGRNTALSVAGRLQYIGSGPNGIATGALTALLRLSFYTEEGDKMRWYFAPTAGVGEGFRFQVDATVIDKDGHPSMVVKDTVRGGPFVAGAGTGMIYRLGRHWRWTVDSQFLVGIPNVSAVLDVTTGGRWEF